MGPRIAPPTPPIGLGAEVASAFGVTAGPSAAAAPAFPAPHAANAPRRCGVCETMNAPNLRYCTSCGSTLEGAQASAPPAAAAPATHPPTAPLPQAPPAIAPMRVVDLGAPAATAEARTCSRCRGIVDSGAQFCKFCGASLADAPPAAMPPTNGRPAADAAPVASPSPIAASPYAPPPAPVVAAVAPPQPAAPLPASRQPTRPTSASKTYGNLVVIAKSGADGQSYPITDDLDIGRLEGAIIVGEDPYLSPRHARILHDGKALVLRDLASTNGVYLRLAATRDVGRGPSGEVLVPLQDHDLILVGQQVLRLELLSEVEGGLGPASEQGTLLFGSPASPRYARLTQRTVEGVTRDVYYLRKGETVLGRESGDVVFTEDPFLSRRHAAIRILGRDGAPVPPTMKPAVNEVSRFALVDLGSSNGTFLRTRGDVELHQGDHFRVGQQLFRVDLTDGSR